MSRVFGRGELASALLHTVLEVGPATGYTVMHHLAERLDERWRPSPGAVYPALLALEDDGLVTGHDEGTSVTYRITPAGRRACEQQPDLIDRIAGRTGSAGPTLGDVVDHFARALPRGRRLTPNVHREVSAVLADASRRITRQLDNEEQP